MSTSSFASSTGGVAAVVVDRTTEAFEASAVHTRIMASAFARCDGLVLRSTY